MVTAIRSSLYKDQPAVTLETDQITAQFLPGAGGQLCSFVYRPLGLELLVQRPWERYRLGSYDGDYVAEGECAGMDDMFPTIDRCFYDLYPWRGTPIPDHGEVWSLPWEDSIVGETLHLAVNGVRFPYRLEKQISFSRSEILHIAYRLTNLSAFDFDFLWAAHPMFVLEEGARLVLPEGMRKAVVTFTLSGEMGRYGDEVDWPLAVLPDGRRRDLRQIRPKATRAADKFYFKEALPEGWCALTYPRSDLTLALSFPVEHVPYLGILPNEGGWHDLYNIFIEPATAPFDRPDLARMRGQGSSVGPYGSYEWHLNLAIGQGTTPRAVTRAGRIEFV